MLDSHGQVPASNSLSFEVNGACVTAIARPVGDTGAVFSFPVDRVAAEAPFLTVALKSPYGIAPRVFGSPDKRRLGAAVRSIRMSP